MSAGGLYLSLEYTMDPTEIDAFHAVNNIIIIGGFGDEGLGATNYGMGSDGNCPFNSHDGGVVDHICLVQNCSRCIYFISTTCENCENGPLNLDGTCLPPLPLPSMCYLTHTEGICTLCVRSIPEGTKQRGVYMASDGSCQLCNPNCRRCTSPNQCTLCWQDMALIDDTCKNCVDKCDSCEMETGNYLFCARGHYLSADRSECLPCSQGCAICTGPAEIECQGCDIANRFVGIN